MGRSEANEGGQRRGRPLRRGDHVALLAPSSPVEPADVHLGAEWVRARGWVAASRADVHDARGHLAGGDWRRAWEVNGLVSDPAVRALWCARGGFGAARILEAIDLSAVRADPKPVIGFSDATALLVGLYAGTGLVSIHGPLATGAARMSERSAALLQQLLTRSDPVGRLSQDGELSALRPGAAEGPLLGGNLVTLAALAGTPFWPDFEGAILFLEEEPTEPLLVVDRAFTQLRLAGAFRGLAGLLVGAFPAGAGGLLAELARDVTGPVLVGFPAGHGTANVPLPVGARVALQDESLVALEPVVAGMESAASD